MSRQNLYFYRCARCWERVCDCCFFVHFLVPQSALSLDVMSVSRPSEFIPWKANLRFSGNTATGIHRGDVASVKRWATYEK
jgi:hypothetical protein